MHPRGLPFSPMPTHPRPRREKSSGAGERSWVEKHPQASAAGNPSSWQPLEAQLRPQLVPITVTGSRACCGGGVPLLRAAFVCRRHSLPATCQAGAALGGVRPAGTSPRPPARRPAIAFLPLPGSLWAPPDLALLPGIVREAFNTSKPTPGRPPPPSPVTWNPDRPGFYVCRAFGKQNA